MTPEMQDFIQGMDRPEGQDPVHLRNNLMNRFGSAIDNRSNDSPAYEMNGGNIAMSAQGSSYNFELLKVPHTMQISPDKQY